MALPKLETPTYTLILPSTGKQIKYRPFLVKEYKILLTALESDASEIHRLITELVDVCTFNNVNALELPNFDLEYVFLQIRAKSIGEMTNLELQCNNCETKISFDLDISKAEVIKNPEHNSKVVISDNMTLEMRYPKFSEMAEIYENFNTDKAVDLLCMCIKSILTPETVYDDFTKEEITEFVNSFSKQQFEKIEQFFLTMPKLTQHVEQTCSNCGSKNEVNLEGLQNFFV